MKKGTIQQKKLTLFYEEIEPKRDINEQMRLQTDLEFQQTEILKLNIKYNVLMVSAKIRGGKAFAAVQKLEDLKLLLKCKIFHISTSSRLRKPKKLIQRAVDNMNNITLQKYGFSPDFVKSEQLNNEKFRQVYDFHRLVKSRNLLKDMNILILNQIDGKS